MYILSKNIFTRFIFFILFFLSCSVHAYFVKQLFYTDLIITDTRIISIIESQAFQRLENVQQYGIDTKVLPRCKHSGIYNRANHSLGVYYLLQRYNAPFEEQVAGL